MLNNSNVELHLNGSVDNLGLLTLREATLENLLSKACNSDKIQPCALKKELYIYMEIDFASANNL
jgi:hypothetical protein